MYTTDLPRRLRNPVHYHEDGTPKQPYRGKSNGFNSICTKTEFTHRSFEDIYGRIDGKSFFKTAMTTVMPNAKGGPLLHPTVSTI